MERKQLGESGIEVPEVGIGTWRYRGGIGPLRRGLELGSFLIDTAEAYGTEEMVGRALKGLRAEAFIATKVSGGHLRYDDVLRSAEGSLRRLGTDYIDLYQVHWPNARIPIGETMRAMESLVESGKVRFIGVSNFTVRAMQEAQEALGRSRIVSNQVQYHLLDRGIERDLLPYCQQHGVSVLAHSPLAMGALTSKPLFRHKAAMEELRRVSGESGKSMAQVALNWCTSRPPVIAIPKSDQEGRVEENCLASGWRLSQEQLDTLDRAFR